MTMPNAATIIAAITAILGGVAGASTLDGAAQTSSIISAAVVLAVALVKYLDTHDKTIAEPIHEVAHVAAIVDHLVPAAIVSAPAVSATPAAPAVSAVPETPAPAAPATPTAPAAPPNA